MPTVLASGTSWVSSRACSSTGFMSLVPETLPPGASLLATRPEAAGSVTAVTRMGMSRVACAAACAAGVAMARIRSTSSLTNFVAMVAHTVCSPWAFCVSISMSSPDASSAATKPSRAASSAACSVSWMMPTR